MRVLTGGGLCLRFLRGFLLSIICHCLAELLSLLRDSLLLVSGVEPIIVTGTALGEWLLAVETKTATCEKERENR